MKYRKGSTALWAHHVSVGFTELVWRSWTGQFSECCYSGKSVISRSQGANQGKDFPIYMQPKSLVRQKLMSKMDFSTKSAIALIFSGYWVYLPGVEGGQSFVPFICALCAHSCWHYQTWGWQAQLSLPALCHLALIWAGSIGGVLV